MTSLYSLVMNKEDYKILPLALVGAAEGVWRYYARPVLVDGLRRLTGRILGSEDTQPWEEQFFDSPQHPTD